MSYPENKINKKLPCQDLGVWHWGRKEDLRCSGLWGKGLPIDHPTLEYSPCHLLVKRFFVNSDLSEIGLL